MKKNIATRPDAQQANTKKQYSGLLRAKAENLLAKIPATADHTLPMAELLHELEIHQIELEMQNDELRHTQAILETSRNRYVDFYDFAPVGYLTLSEKGELEEINLTGASLLGEERGKLLQRKFSSFVAPDDRVILRNHLATVLQSDQKQSCELSLVPHNRALIMVQLDSLRLLRDEGSPVIRVAITDITQLKLTEQAMREQQEFFLMITENIEDFIAVLDLQGRRLYNSPSYAKLFNNVEKIKGTDSFAEVHHDDREQVRRVFHQTVQSGSGLQIEYRFLLADGSVHYMESRGVLIKNDKNQAKCVVVISRDITERKQAEEKIRNLAFYDALTQLPNRRMLDDRMNHAMASSKRSGRHCALMFLDLDNFKPLNDLHGHSAGDMLLIEVARRISSCVREMDTVARFGGDEFVVMLSELDTDLDSSLSQARIVAEKIRTILALPYVLKLKTKDKRNILFEHQCTSSIGAVMFTNHEYTPDEIIKRADICMYQAKENGRNQVYFEN